MKDLTLKPAVSDDFEDYYKIRCSPGDIYWNGYTAKPDRESFQNLFLNRLGNAPFEKPEDRRIYLIQLVDEDDADSIGFVQLINRSDGIDIGYTVTEEYQGKGYATQALRLGTEIAKKMDHRIYVQIRDDNIASQCVAKKCGFVETDEYEKNDYPGAGVVKLRKHRLIIEG